MKSYRIVLDYTTISEHTDRPDFWDWYNLIAENYGYETVSVVDVKEIATPEGHVEYFAEITDNV